MCRGVPLVLLVLGLPLASCRVQQQQQRRRRRHGFNGDQMAVCSLVRSSLSLSEDRESERRGEIGIEEIAVVAEAAAAALLHTSKKEEESPAEWGKDSKGLPPPSTGCCCTFATAER